MPILSDPWIVNLYRKCLIQQRACVNVYVNLHEYRNIND
jgi:hypothetical protein